jgi:hypothetical protein
VGNKPHLDGKEVASMDDKGKKNTVMTTALLAEVNQESARRDFNRLLSDQFFEDVDPEGIHLITLAMPHGDADHVRVVFLAKMRNEKDPVTVTIDMTWDAYSHLPYAVQRTEGDPSTVQFFTHDGKEIEPTDD